MDLLDKYCDNNYRYIVVDRKMTCDLYYWVGIKDWNGYNKLKPEYRQNWEEGYIPPDGTKCKLIKEVERHSFLMQQENKKVFVIRGSGLRTTSVPWGDQYGIT